jgi:hypothetical protein
LAFVEFLVISLWKGKLMNTLKSARIVMVVCLSLSFVKLAASAALDPNGYTSLGTLNVSSGTLTFDTDALQVTGGGALSSTTGVLQSQGGGNPDIAVFTFNDVTVGSSVGVQIIGSRPIAILSQSNLLIDADVLAVGANGSDGTAFGSPAPNGNNGQNGTSGSSSGGNGGPAPLADEPGGKGGTGGYNTTPGQDGNNGSGGASGGNGGAPSGGAFMDGGTGGTGVAGSNGTPGPSGTGGVGATGGMSFVLVGGSNGNSGVNGTNGKGGGGGGGGGGGLDTGFPTFLDGDRGGGGGSGGAGGSGGDAGQGGEGGRAIEFVAVGTASFNGGFTSAGGDGGDGAAGQLGGAGGTGGSGPDDAGPGGPGGKGGNGGAGGAGGGGGGGTIFLSAGTLNAPTDPILLAGGAHATSPSGGVSGPGGAGLFRFEGTLAFDVTSGSIYDQLFVIGSIDPAGDIHFNFSNESIADAFASTFTLDDFFTTDSGPVGSVAPYLGLNYSGSSPTRQFEIALLPDGTFSVTATVPEPGTGALAVIALGMFQRFRRRSRRRVSGNGSPFARSCRNVR